MSSCIVFQQNQKCYLASDGAVSIRFTDKNIRIKDDYKKTFQYENKLIFCSGKMEMVKSIVNAIKSKNKLKIHDFSDICKAYYEDSENLELFLLTYDKEIISYQISSYNNFKPIKRVIKGDNTEILSLGFNSKNNLEVAFTHIGKHNNIETLIKNIYKDICCPEVGGIVDIFEISNKGIKSISSIDLKDGYCINNIIKNNDKNLLVGETIVGKIVAGHNLLIGNENNTMVIDGNGINIESNCLFIKGTDGTNRDFEAYITMLSDQITAGVSDSKNHTDAQFKILSDGIATKVSKGDDFKTEFKQTSQDFDFDIGNGTMNVNINKNGQTIRNGGLTVTNSNGTVVIDGSSNMFKIVSVVEVVLSAGDQTTYIHKIHHGMGYVPAYLAYQVGSYSVAGESTNTLLPALTVSGAGSGSVLNFTGIIRANADENDIIITYTRASTELISNPRVKVFILKEALI